MTWLTPHYFSTAIAGLSAFIVCAAGNSLNDLLDIEIDRINKPERVLVRGALSKRFALWLTIILSILAVGISLLVNLSVAVVVLVAILLLLSYNFYLKKIPVIGNIVIAFLGALTFITGGLAIDFDMTWDLPGPLIPAVFAFLLHLVREMLKDVEDISGDRMLEIKTLPQLIGVNRTLLISLFLFFILVILTFIPIFTGWFGRIYEIITVYIIDLPMLILLILIWGNPSQKMLKIGSYSLKFCMVLGVIALLMTR